MPKRFSDLPGYSNTQKACAVCDHAQLCTGELVADPLNGNESIEEKIVMKPGLYWCSQFVRTQRPTPYPVGWPGSNPTACRVMKPEVSRWYDPCVEEVTPPPEAPEALPEKTMDATTAVDFDTHQEIHKKNKKAKD